MATSRPPPGRSGADLFLVVWSAVVLTVTLWPLDPLPPEAASGSFLATPPVADALRNLLLMAPLGAGLAGRGQGVGRAAALGLGFAAVIETAQLWVPGRSPRASDILLNGAGAGLAALCLDPKRVRLWLISGLAPGIAPTVAGALPLAAGCALTGWLLAVHLPATVYDPAWTPRLEWLESYSGQVLAAQIGDEDFPPRAPAPDPEVLRRALRSREPISLRAVAGPAPPGLAPLLRVNDPEREILLVGVDGADLVVRLHSRGREIGLENPSVRLPGLLADLSEGDRFALSLRFEAAELVVQRSGARARRVGHRPGEGWRLLFDADAFPAGAQRALDGLWILLLALPLGLRLAWRWGALLPASLLVGILFLLPTRVGLASAAEAEWVAAAAAGLTGLVRAAREPKPPSSADVAGTPAEGSP